MLSRICISLFLCLAAAAWATAAEHLVAPGSDGKLVYTPWDSQGDTIPDFSNCGYEGGGVKIPDVPVKLTVQSGGGSDDTTRLQKAIDQLSKMPLDSQGFRGALLFARGEYRIAGTLNVRADGVVLRGEGSSESGTVLIATGTAVRSLIELHGQSRPDVDGGQSRQILDSYVPLGAHSIQGCRRFRAACRRYGDRPPGGQRGVDPFHEDGSADAEGEHKTVAAVQHRSRSRCDGGGRRRDHRGRPGGVCH